MNIFKKSLFDQSVKVERFYHRQDEVHHDPDEEIAPCYMLNFIEQGNFEFQVGKQKWTLDEQKIFVTYPTMKYRYNHFEEMPSDVCLSIKFSEKLAEDVFSFSDFNLQKMSPVILRNNRLAYLQWQILRLVEIEDFALEAETLAAELLSAIGHKTKHKTYQSKQLSWYAERVVAICRLFETQYEMKHSLDSLSCFAGLSPFHLTRVFKELTSQSPHHFLLNVRLKNAANQLLDGVSVTDVCFACGFANPSHFIRSFQRKFGITPLQFQKKISLKQANKIH